MTGFALAPIGTQGPAFPWGDVELLKGWELGANGCQNPAPASRPFVASGTRQTAAAIRMGHSLSGIDQQAH